MLAVAGIPGEGIGRDIGEDPRRAGADHLGHARRLVKPWSIVAIEPLGKRESRRIDVMGRDALDLTLVLEEVDRAPIGDLRDDQSRHALKRLAVVHRGGQHATGLGHEALRDLQPVQLGEKSCVVDRQGRPTRELEHQRHIFGAVGGSRAEPQDRERSERAFAREQGRHHRRAVAMLDHEAGVL